MKLFRQLILILLLCSFQTLSFGNDRSFSRLSVHALAKFTLIAIAQRCGFNSKTSFYRIFKNETGKNPDDYQKERKFNL